MMCGGQIIGFGDDPTGRQTRASHLNAVYSSRPPDCANLKIPKEIGEKISLLYNHFFF